EVLLNPLSLSYYLIPITYLDPLLITRIHYNNLDFFLVYLTISSYVCAMMSNFLPSRLVSALKNDFNINAEEFIASHELGEQVTSIRINPFKPTDQFKNLAHIPWCKEGYYLNTRPVFTLDPLFHAGTYYVQEASSMFIAHVIRALEIDQHPLIALDLCAAPGGKSTLLNSTLHADSLLIANEIIKTRVQILANNLTKWGNSNTIVSHNDPASFNRLPGFFDLLLVDAPCSGSGMFRKDPQSITEWSEDAVKLCSQRQQRILADSLSTLKEEGILIYSTCSYSMEENENIADWLIDQHGLQNIPIPIDSSWGIEETKSSKHHALGYRFYPSKVKGEGLYVSCFVKKSNQHTFSKKRIKTDTIRLDNSLLNDWITPNAAIDTIPFKDDVLLIPKQYSVEFQSIKNVLYLKKAGTILGKINRNALLPNHELALSNLKSDNIQRIELSLEDALQYLRKADIPNNTTKAGWALACYQDYALGWVKVLANRINNYYPKEWRIVNL
ncbi:methyltransferase RsmF C-terminal domain-like protein, partial [Olivibacter ginsenosidimutans]|uniref:methyltransferase RsmF C-terminal domain-like protein n=1 Tax=Olivibacter ginsenosidimutans TaxID=1176537 RepID=UPI0031F047E2